MSKPSEFHVGILGFLAVLLPGAIGVAVAAPVLKTKVLEAIMPMPEDDLAVRWALFLVTAYVLGHLLFLAGAYLDGLYNYVRKKRKEEGHEKAFNCATSIKEKFLGPDERSAANTFQWARALLTALFPQAAGDIHTLEAESKFFRSLFVVLAFATVLFLVQGKLWEALFCGVLIGPCFARYYDQRRKSTTRAYLYVITLHRLGKLAMGSAPSEPAP